MAARASGAQRQGKRKQAWWKRKRETKTMTVPMAVRETHGPVCVGQLGQPLRQYGMDCHAMQYQMMMAGTNQR